MAFFRRSRSTSQIDDCVAGQIDPDGPGLALAVVAGEAVAHTGSYGLADVSTGRPVAQDTIFHLASGGKQFTGLGILMLAEDGKLQLDDPIGKHLALLAGFGPRVTIRHLLHHTSGIRDLSDDDGVELMQAHCEQPKNADLIRTYADLGCPMAGKRIGPGDAFSYSNSGYELLGALIEKVSSQSYHDFFAGRVFDRLDMKNTFSVPDRRVKNSATGYTQDDWGELVKAGETDLDNLVGSGSFYTTASDLCRYDRALRTGSLVNAASMKEAFTSGRTNDGKPTNYGFGWYLAVQDGIYFADHEGEWNGFRSYICYCLDRPLSIFALSNDPEANLLEIADVAADVCR